MNIAVSKFGTDVSRDNVYCKKKLSQYQSIFRVGREENLHILNSYYKPDTRLSTGENRRQLKT